MTLRPAHSIAILLLFADGLAAQAPPAGLKEDFESCPVGSFPCGWSYSGNSDIRIDGSTAFLSARSARLHGIVGGCWAALLHRRFNVPPPYTLEFQVRNGSETLRGCHPDRARMGLYTGPDWRLAGRSFITFRRDGSIRSDSSLGVIGSYKPNEWLKVKVGYERLPGNRVALSYWINDEFKGTAYEAAASFEDSLTWLSPIAEEGSAWFDNITVTPGVDKLGVFPNSGGNTGLVTIVIHGGRFLPGTSVRLSGGSGIDTVADPVAVDASGSSVSATFDLVGQPSGVRDITISHPAQPATTIKAGFTVQDGVSANLAVRIIGFDRIRADRAQTYEIQFANKGNIDAIGVPLWIAGIPKDAEYTILSNIHEPPFSANVPVVQSDRDWREPVHHGERWIPLIIPHVPGQSTGSLRISIKIPTSVASFQLRAWANPPLYRSPLSADFRDCLFEGFKTVADFVPGVGCIVSLAEPWVKRLIGARGGAFRLFDYVVDIGLSCVPLGGIAEAVRDILKGFIDGSKLHLTCLKAFAEFAFESLSVQQVQSLDPNAKLGPRGDSDAHFIGLSEPLRYSILFENSERASASAQTVLLEDTLDKHTIDFASLRFDRLVLGKKQFPFTPGQTSNESVLDLRPEINLLVHLKLRFDVDNGLIWAFMQAVDPSTGRPPDDPSAGFLRPNKNPPEGEGTLYFTVMPRRGQISGTSIRNQATITFDGINPIQTETWVNTIDIDPPTSAVSPLAPIQSSSDFVVDWSGSDVGSTVRDFTVYVSDNGGPFEPWLINTALTQAVFRGTPDHRYEFYSVAKDLAGNHETTKTAPDTSTRVPLEGCAANLSDRISVGRSGFRRSNVTQRWLQTLTLTNGSTAVLAGPSVVALDGLSKNATLHDPVGTTRCALPAGNPVVLINAGPNWAPGQSVSVNLEFANPTNAGIIYTPRILGGSSNR